MKMKAKAKVEAKQGKIFRNWFDRSEGPSERKIDSFYLNVRYSVRNRRRSRWPGFGLFSSNSGSGSGSEPSKETVSSSRTMKLNLAVGLSSVISVHARADSTLKASIALQVLKIFRFLKRTERVRLTLKLNFGYSSRKVTIKRRTSEFLRRCCSSIRQLSIRDRGGSLTDPAAPVAAGKHDEGRQGDDDAGTFSSRPNLLWEARHKTLPLKFTSVLGALSAWTAIFFLGWALVAIRVHNVEPGNLAAALCRTFINMMCT